MVLPGLYDSHVHPLGVVTTELASPPPVLRSLKDAFAYIRNKAKTTPKGEWIVLRFAFPTRLDEARFPTPRSWTRPPRSIPCCTTPGRPAWSTRPR